MSLRVDTIRRVYELFNQLPADVHARRASPVTEELLGLFTTDVEFTQPAMQPEGAQSFSGREELRASWDQWFEMWEQHRTSLEEVIERENRLLVLSTESFRGREGVELEQRTGSIFVFRGAQIARFEAFFDRDTAQIEFERLTRA